ncbi:MULTISPECIES: TonB-dependent hemoglobin/transferrin/lactoferrin family receptor [unclassified Sphingopyxis]|uniref:TonB-dependent hemoglobin/transferrin/lactoferrin family receptor n=1 Tax=unclassified Sphingopyxis TaxID=2614943 RepID=UPI0028544546|nr:MULTISPECIES: TonB-dependent hemoglobin/transferrin/lactoferrin family receptor [unclassified Sphingopyxis]MDR6832481.1 hemoglobin/transferrin/lactoferrin receptor protein [Sphingopyxis sp. BE122]MDR7228224.1 hemoglobin/transferrin/lactoferrin receptor protein [Sphingopyxis sp. BE259]
MTEHRSPPAVRLAAGTALGLALAAAATPALAQDNDGDYWAARKNQIVVTATRTAVKAEDIPVTVTVKSDEQIADELVTDIRDLVRFEPGVSVQRQPARFGAALGATGRAGNDSFNIRGIGGNRVLIQVDGVRVPDGFSFGAQASGRGDYVDLGLVKSVEILRGPSSALYGSDGLAGAVSFITSDPSDFLAEGKNIGGLVRASYSSADEEFSETAILAGRSGDWSAMAAYTRRDYKELENQGSLGTAGGIGATRTLANPQDGRSDAALARIVYDPASGHKLRLTGEYLDTRLYTNGLSGRSASVDRLEGFDTGERKRVSLDWSWEGEGAIDFARVALYWQDGEDRQYTEEDRTPLPDRTRLNTFENRVFGASADARADFATGAITHRLVFGGDISQTRQRGLRGGTVPPAGETYPTRAFPSTDFTRAGLFVGDEIAVAGGRLLLYPALRFDWYDLSPDNDPLLPTFRGAKQDGSRLSPKFGAVWKITNEVRLFANYATGFKAPEPGQVNQFFENLTSPFSAYRTLPNPDLGPERSESFEGGARFSSDAVSLDLTAFSARYKDFISQEQVGGVGTIANPILFQFVNLDRVRVKGAEARFEGRASSGLYATLALSYAKGDIIDPDGVRSPLSSIDPLKLVAGVGYREAQGRFGGQIIMTHAARKEASRANGLCTPECFRPDGFTILDATAFARITDGLTLRAGVFNILDKKYSWWSDVRGLAMGGTATAPTVPASADAYTQPGRNASVSLSFRF